MEQDDLPVIGVILVVLLILIYLAWTRLCGRSKGMLGIHVCVCVCEFVRVCVCVKVWVGASMRCGRVYGAVCGGEVVVYVAGCVCMWDE